MNNENYNQFVTTSEKESNESVISIINGLIQTCRDGQDGYKDAAEGIERSDLKSLFYEYSQERSQFAGVLQGLVRSLGGDPETEGTISGTLHRGWIDLKSAITGGNEHSILTECERGEDIAKAAYSSALEHNLPAEVTDVIRQQSQTIQAAHNRIKELRDSKSNTAGTGSGF